MKKVLVIFILFTMGTGLAFAQLQENKTIKGSVSVSTGLHAGFGSKAGLLANFGGGYMPDSQQWSIRGELGIGALYGSWDERIAYERVSYGTTRTDYVELNSFPFEASIGALFQYYMPFVGFSAGAGFVSNTGLGGNIFVPYIRMEAFYPLLVSGGNLHQFGLGFDYVFWNTDKPVDLPPGYRVNLVWRYMWHTTF